MKIDTKMSQILKIDKIKIEYGDFSEPSEFSVEDANFLADDTDGNWNKHMIDTLTGMKTCLLNINFDCEDQETLNTFRKAIEFQNNI